MDELLFPSPVINVSQLADQLHRGIVRLENWFHRYSMRDPLSSQTNMLDPSPTRVINPSFGASLLAIISRHIAEEVEGVLACMKSKSGKYLPLCNLAHSELGSVKSHHPCFPSSAKLKNSGDENPFRLYI